MQYIRITSLPIQLEAHTTKAQLNMHYYHPKLNIQRQRNGLSIQSTPSKLAIDNRGFFDSLGYKCISSMSDEVQQVSRQAILQTIARFAEEGNLMAEMGKGAIAQIAMQRMDHPVEVNIGFSPSVKPDISWSEGQVNIEYTPDQLTFDWEIQRPELQVSPSRVEYNIKQWHQVIIEYVGPLIYVPPSAAPDLSQIAGQYLNKTV